MLLFEVTEGGTAVARMVIPKPTETTGVNFGGYRALPWSDIGGESTSSPFGPMAHLVN